MSKTSKLGAFVLLDFRTIKPVFISPSGLFTLGFIGLIAVLFTAFTGTVLTSVLIGVFFGTSLSGAPFGISEKDDLDTLYLSLGVERKTVVCGRFLSALLFDCCSVACSLVFGTVGVLLVRLAGMKSDGLSITPVIVFGGAAVFLLSQAFNIMFCFKFGCSKATYMGIIPMILVLVGIILFLIFTKGVDMAPYFTAFASWVAANTALTIAICVAVFIALMFFTYTVSQRAYAKKEF
jgi:hypothetical protein